MPDRVSAAPVPGADANIARHLSVMAAAQPQMAALKIPRGRTARGNIDYDTLSYAELDLEVSAWSERLRSAGIRRGDRTLVMVRQGLPLIAAVFALFRNGAVPIVIDPGMGLKSFLGCVARSRPRAVVGIPLALVISHFFRSAFSSVAVRVAASSSLTARLPRAGSHALAPPEETRSAPTDLAAVLFTSGSTGAPKGVCYEHGMFDAQIRTIRATYGIEPGEIDLPLLPIFALFDPALGMTTIVPEMDPRRPAALNPARIVQAIRQEKVTNSFGSPTLWRKLGDHCRANALTLPSLRRVLCAGAPVPSQLWQDSHSFLPNGKLHSPYGATEALPIATISSTEVELDSTRGACVGHPVRDVDIRIIAITDAPIASWSAARELPPGAIGEIIVFGPMVTKRYDAMPEATLQAKIPAPAVSSAPSHLPLPTSAAVPAAVWHRLGDCGYRDAEGRLWYCGRKAERVQTATGTLYTEPCEQVFRRHPRAARCALIGLGEIGKQEPALVVETRTRNAAEARSLAHDLRRLALQHPHTTPIRRFYFRPRFPVDVRHNAKIHRLTLAKWAAAAQSFIGESEPVTGHT